MTVELLDRYLAAVAQHLPPAKRDDVARELRANILDQLDSERTGSPSAPTDTLLRAVLVDLGPPRQMAHRFHQPPPLIRPEHLPIYQWTLFLVFGVLFLIQIVDSSIQWLSSPSMTLLLFVKSVASGLIRDGVFAFTAISIAFWLMGKEPMPTKPATARAWNPDTLPPLVRAWQRISLVDIFSDLGSNLFLLVLIWYPVWASLPSAIFLTEATQTTLQLLSPLLVAGVGIGLWQLRQRIWTAGLLRANLALNAMLAAALTTLALSGPLVTDVPERLDWIEPGQWSLSVTLTLLAITLYLVWDVLRGLWRLRQLKG